MRGGLYYSVLGGFGDVAKYLVEKNADLTIQDINGDNCLHIACQARSKELVLWMMLEGVEYEQPNSMEKQPGDEQPEMKLFIAEISEEYRCFKQLPTEDIKRLRELFAELDYNKSKTIDSDKSAKFNKFIDKRVSTFIAEKDADDFISDAAILDGENVSLDEWIYAWAKLYVSDRRIYDKFHKEYEDVTVEVGMNFKQFMEAQGEEY